MAAVLVVEDDPDSLEILDKALTRAGHTTRCVHNGQEALGAVAGQPPDLIVLDMQMPVMNGVHFLEALRFEMGLQSIPVVIVTAVLTLAESEALDAAAVFEKSNFQLSDLVQTVDALTRKDKPN